MRDVTKRDKGGWLAKAYIYWRDKRKEAKQAKAMSKEE